MATTKVDPAKVVTGKVRFSYVHIFKPRKDEETGRETYQVCALIPKTDTKTIAAINAAIDYVKNDPKSHSVWGSKFLASFKTPLRDGDTERDTEKQPEYKGHFFINLNSGSKPGIVDAHVQEIPFDRADEVYSGCYGKASFRVYPYKQNGGIGIAAGLDNIQKLAEGERLGGRSAPEDDFSAEADEEDSILG